MKEPYDKNHVSKPKDFPRKGKNKRFGMARFSPLLLCVATILISLAGCSDNEAAVTVGPSEVFTIGIGESARITGENILVTFNEVIGDSRCPKNVTCVWEGVASSRITINYQGKDYVLALNQPGFTEQAKESFFHYLLTYSLNPYPGEGEQIPPKEYLLTLSVTR